MADILSIENVIAQDDDNDYSESGYVVCVDGDRAAIGSYSHCSCYGTWEEGNPTEIWSGTVHQLVMLAVGDFDPTIEGRRLSDEDWDVDHLRACYKQVLDWHAENTTRSGREL